MRTGTHSFTVDGTRLVYHVTGTGPVMIAHSGGPGVDYSYLRSPRLEERFTMVYLEPAGTGASGPLQSGATYVFHVYALVERLGVDRVHLLGHSHSGFVAQRFAVLHPERTAGIALYSTSPTTDAEFWAAERAAAEAYPQRHPDVPEAAAIRDSLGKFGEVRTSEEKSAALGLALPLYFADYWGRRRVQGAAGQHPGLGHRFPSTTIDYRADLPSITARTVIVTGRHDFICGPVWAGQLHDAVSPVPASSSSSGAATSARSKSPRRSWTR